MRELISPDFERHVHAQLNEEELIHDLLSKNSGGKSSLMFDVGANFGNSLDIFLGREWDVVAFEPDPDNRRLLTEYFGRHPSLTIIDKAIALEDGQVVSFYASDESSGISSLTPFTSGHRQTAQVETIRLDTYLESVGNPEVEFLKIDVEGHDFFALKSFPLAKQRPTVILVEFEDKKTVSLGYNVHDMAAYLGEYGYKVYVSEWHPIIRYGIAHDWRRLIEYSPSLALDETWGNLIALRDPDFELSLKELLFIRLRFGRDSSLGIAPVKPKANGNRGRVTLTRVVKRFLRSVARLSPRLSDWLFRKLRGLKRRL